MRKNEDTRWSEGFRSLGYEYNEWENMGSFGNPIVCRYCDAPNPGCPLTTRQSAEIYMSHVMRPIHVQKWPLRPTQHTHKMYILYKNDLITICLQFYLIAIYTKMGLLLRILQNYKIRPAWPFLRF